MSVNGFENENMATQTKLIREFLETNGWIDGETAKKICGTTRLSAHIYILRNDPVNPMKIRTERKKFIGMLGRPGSYAVYHYEKGEEESA